MRKRTNIELSNYVPHVTRRRIEVVDNSPKTRYCKNFGAEFIVISRRIIFRFSPFLRPFPNPSHKGRGIRRIREIKGKQKKEDIRVWPVY